MEENLAKLISQHQSMPHLCEEEPCDPFQKIHFGKKMRKSKLNACHSTSRNNIDSQVVKEEVERD